MDTVSESRLVNYQLEREAQMTFAAHGLIGAAFCSLPSYGGRRWMRIASTALGLLGGIAPDAADWIAATALGAQRWVLYERMHTGDLVQAFSWHPAYNLHLWMDRFIHVEPAYDWWADYWWMEIGCWAVGLAALAFVYLKEIGELHDYYITRKGWRYLDRR